MLASERAAELKAANPSLPVYPAGKSASKLSAAWLIEACGWRGFRDADAGISAQHALVLVNHGHATGAELLASRDGSPDPSRSASACDSSPSRVSSALSSKGGNLPERRHPDPAMLASDVLDRRDFLTRVGAAAGLAGLGLEPLPRRRRRGKAPRRSQWR